MIVNIVNKIIYSYELLPFSISLLDASCIGLIVGVFGQLGDFVESKFKRDISKLLKPKIDVLKIQSV